jgi:uncharacterized delta-60 repeat protein
MKNPPSFSRLLSHLLPAVSLSLCALGAAHAQTPGSQDFTFATGPQADSTVLALALQPNGQVLAGGIFANFRGQPRTGVARLNPDGSLDSLNPGLVLSGYEGGSPTVNAIAVQADGQIIVAGSFNVIGQTAGVGIARLNAADGSLDSTFNAGSGVFDNGGSVGAAYALAVLPNGQILVGGDFITFNGVPYTGLVRLNADGSLDTTFNTNGAGVNPNGYGHYVHSIAVQSNGQIVIGGGFNEYDGVQEGGVARLNADGTLDQSFNVGEGVDYAANAVAVQSNGQVIVGGGFNNFDGANIPTHLVRLNTDGSLDTSYYASNTTLFISEIDSIVLQPDDEAIIGGIFLASGGLVNGPHNGVARIQTDGLQDLSFDSGDNDNGETDAGQAYALVLQPDGKVIEASDFGEGYSFPSDVFRLYATGSATVSIATGVAQTTENSGAPATFILTLSSAQSVDLKVAYTVKGTGQNGVDYSFLKGTAKIKAGKTSKTIPVTPYDRGISGGGKATVKLTLMNGTGYTVGTPDVAKVKIIDND